VYTDGEEVEVSNYRRRIRTDAFQSQISWGEDLLKKLLLLLALKYLYASEIWFKP
jgi:hypothetical protein